MPKIGVVHLVRECNELDAFRSFIDSYQCNPAGVEHELLILFKGFDGADAVEPYRQILKGLTYQEAFLDDVGLDIGSYFDSAEIFGHEYLVFLNSFSVILCPGWLSFMFEHLRADQVGVVGATASWESHSSNIVEAVKSSRSVFAGSRNLRQLLSRYLWNWRAIKRLRRDYALFPNHHIRTNAFMISREVFLSVKGGKVRGKHDAWKFESGRQGLTQTLLQRGLRPLVVGRDGKAYEKEQWAQSNTFRSGMQENLLVSDNQTRVYQSADKTEQQRLTKASWTRKG